jgi:hypothetical protein
MWNCIFLKPRFLKIKELDLLTFLFIRGNFLLIQGAKSGGFLIFYCFLQGSRLYDHG